VVPQFEESNSRDQNQKENDNRCRNLPVFVSVKKSCIDLDMCGGIKKERLD
jgi:hypothetical protein